MKRLVSFLLCVAMVLSFIPVSFAANTKNFEEELARDLKSLGLFKGVSETDFALDRAPTRTEALVMLIRVLGKENDALAKGGKHPFLDVPEWADKYVGYAYENRLTNGISATKFGASSVATSSMYLTFVLRALGYSDTNGADFSWDNPYLLARTCGILIGSPDTIDFKRSDVVLVSYAALEAEVKGTKRTLAEKLIDAGAFTAAEYDKYYDLFAFEKNNNTYEMSAKEIYDECSPAVFLVLNYNEKGENVSIGSGFFINEDGVAVTNYHVIDGASAVQIKCTNGRIYNVLGVYDYNKANDWAIIQIDGKDFPYLEIDENAVKGGEEIYTIGNPEGLENTISEGLVSNPNRMLDGISHIQISAPISPGSSGGALLNKYGKVTGITSAGFNVGQNLNLAIPISAIKGYKAERVYPFSALFEGDRDEPFGYVDLDMYPEDERAHELLRMWIYDNQNKTMDWGPGYIEVYDMDDGAQLQYIISYHEHEENFVVRYNEFAPSNEYVASIELTFGKGKGRFAEIFASYYEEEAYDDWGDPLPDGFYSYGMDTIEKKDVKEGFEIYFDVKRDDDTFINTTFADIVPRYCLLLLKEIDNIFSKDLRKYDLDGVRALGFENCYFD